MNISPSENPADYFSRMIANLPPPDPEYETKRLAKIAEDEERDRQDAILHRWSLANVPGRHAATHPEIDGDWGEAWERLKSRLGRGCIIPITGTRGSGKTQLAVQAIRFVCKSGGYASYTKAMAIFLDIREAMGQKDKSEKEAIKGYITQRLLVIDAMEVRGETDFENRVLDYIIDMRYDAGFDTILISNQKKDDFTGSLGPSIVSRVHEAVSLSNVFGRLSAKLVKQDTNQSLSRSDPDGSAIRKGSNIYEVVHSRHRPHVRGVRAKSHRAGQEVGDMIFHMETYTEQAGDKSHGIGMSVLTLELKHGDEEFRNKVKKAILDCFNAPPEVQEKTSAIGFIQGE